MAGPCSADLRRWCNRPSRSKAWWALILLAGCGGKYGRTVPDDMVNKLTYEDKVDLVEAENDLFVAYDRVDDAENEISAPEIDSAGRRSPSRSPARRLARRDPGTKELAVLSRDEAQARVDYLRARTGLERPDPSSTS